MYFFKFQPKDLNDPRIDMMDSADTERKELKSISLLHEMVMKGNLGKVKKLIKEGANPLDRDINGDTLLHHSASVGELKILKYLIEGAGCNPATEGWQGSTTLHVATQAHAATQAQHLTIVQYLIEECHMDPTTLDQFGWSPLHYAYRHKSHDLIDYLVNCMSEYMKHEDVLSDVGIKLEDKIHCNKPAPNLPNNLKSAVSLLKPFEENIDFLCDPLSDACMQGKLADVTYYYREMQIIS